MTFKIFRKSENKNSFGLRGYWAYHTTHLEVYSFASSTDYAKGQILPTLSGSIELLQHEGTVKQSHREGFIKKVDESCEAKGVPA